MPLLVCTLPFLPLLYCIAIKLSFFSYLLVNNPALTVLSAFDLCTELLPSRAAAFNGKLA